MIFEVKPGHLRILLKNSNERMKTIRIGVDLHSIKGLKQGTRTYTLNLVNALLELDNVNQYFLYTTGNSDCISATFNQSNVLFKRVVPHTRFLRIPVSFPLRLTLDSIDVFHCQYMGPPVGKTPYVVTMHDIIHEYLPQFYPRALRYFMHLFYPISARWASRVITVSESSKRDLIKYYNVPEQKIIVTHLGVSDNFRQIHEEEKIKQVLRKYDITGDYILFVGRLEPRKNISGLIKAFHNLKSSRGIKHKLVIVGMRYFKYEDIFRLVDALGLQDEIIFTGGVEDNDLPMIYNGADLFVYPSFAEGFGIPPLEAMSCGVPVISSNTSSMPEVIGDTGILIDPYNIGELARAIYEVLCNRDLQKEMQAKGLKRAERFLWENTARKTLNVYHDIYEENIKENKK